MARTVIWFALEFQHREAQMKAQSGSSGAAIGGGTSNSPGALNRDPNSSQAYDPANRRDPRNPDNLNRPLNR
jgi:hypothetical protein